MEDEQIQEPYMSERPMVLSSESNEEETLYDGSPSLNHNYTRAELEEMIVALNKKYDFFKNDSIIAYKEHNNTRYYFDVT